MIRRSLAVILLTLIAACDRKPEADPSKTVAPSQHSYAEDVSVEARQRLLARISRKGNINDPNVPRPLVTLEEFFEGNNDYGSIGYNFYPDQPAPADFYHLFKAIRDKAEVVDIRVEIKDLEDPQGWPSTDTVWIITSASVNDIKNWLGKRFRADEIVVGFPTHYTIEHYEIPEGMQAFGVWWD